MESNRKLTRAEAGRLGASASRAARNASKKARIDAYDLNPLLCKNCNNPISYEKRQQGNSFCGHSCRGYFYGAKKRRDASCIVCSGETASRKTKYCLPCRPKNPFKILRLQDAKTDASRRRFLIRIHGVQCWTCKQSEWMGEPIPVELDHVDGNSDNNSEGNLRILCPNCHAQTPTYKGANKSKLLKMTKREISRRKYALKFVRDMTLD